VTLGRAAIVVKTAGLRAVLRIGRCGLLVAAWLMCMTAVAHAQQPNYRLEIDAPEELVQPLREQTLAGRWRTEPGFDAGQMPLFVERAQEEAIAIARAAGFFSASARVFALDPVDGLPGIRIEVDAGARTTVNRVSLALQGTAHGTALERRIVADWPLPEGSFFRHGEWELGKRQLLEQLQQAGYLRARVAESRAEVDVQATTASLSIVVDAGPRLAFGATTVKGLSRYPQSIVDALRPYREGDPYEFESLLTFQQRLRASGQFLGVTVLPDLAALEADPQRETVPVTVELVEHRTQRLTAGVGYSTDQGIRLLGGYTHRNVFGTAWVLESEALIETVRRRVIVGGSSPYDATGHRWQTGVRFEREDIEGELTEKRTVFGGRGKRAGDRDYFVSVQYQDETRVVDTGQALDSSRAAALTLGYAWNLRRVDSRIDPRNGYTVSAQVSGALEALASDRSFLRLYTRLMRFWPMPSDSALAGGMLVGSAEGGWVVANSRDGIPSENLFRTGGAQALRGYDYLSLGVKQGSAVVGGRVLAVGSLEYQHPIVERWYGAAFCDVGNAADTWGDWRAVAGCGVGARWRTPVGPINLDLAYGSEDRGWRMHFSVGFTF
jgi:translocation and assembly module TamA